MNKDSLGDRIKRYEAVSNNKLTPRMPVFVRVDGKAFHTFTRGLPKPYSEDLISAMVFAAKETAKQIQGFKLAYVQSDEATFMLTDTDTLETQGWFNYEVNKLVSITASAFTAHFNYYWHVRLDNTVATAMFDARAFNVPEDDAPNVFIWRQRDWERNSVQMLARSLYSQKELNGKPVLTLQEMCEAKGKDWHTLPSQLRYGTFVKGDFKYNCSKQTYETLKRLIVGEEK